MYDTNCFNQPKAEIRSVDQAYGKNPIFVHFSVPNTENDYLTIYEGS